MTSRQINNLLIGCAIAIGVAAAGVVVAALLLPIDSAGEDVARHPEVTSTTAPASQPAGLDRLFARSFRMSLNDAPQAAAPTAAPAPASAAAGPTQIVVAGTIGSSVALLRIADGSIVARTVGEAVDGAEVVRIEAASVKFRRNGQEFSIAKPAAADPSAGMILTR